MSDKIIHLFFLSETLNDIYLRGNTETSTLGEIQL